MYRSGNKPNKPKMQKQSEENITKIIKNLFKLKNKTKLLKRLGYLDKEYLDKIKPSLRDIIIHLQEYGSQKVQLTRKNIFLIK